MSFCPPSFSLTALVFDFRFPCRIGIGGKCAECAVARNKKKSRTQVRDFWWGMVDSDHRSQRQQIYSLPPLATREIPHMELVNGVEPSTC